MKLRLWFSACPLGFAAFASACGWDNDTLAAESKGIPELLDALVGRIAIYPKEYYEFRINRSSKIVAANPNNLNELDNLIVAYDKVGNYQQALNCAELKFKALAAKPDKEHEYRYYANLGTIEAHEWVRRKDHDDKSLLDLSIKHLKKCIEINPEAHFGREIVQVKLIEMMRQAKDLIMPNDIDESALSRQENFKTWNSFVKATGESKVQKGIIGIMSLGSGPDSPDLLAAIIPTIEFKKGTIIEIASRRLKELLKLKPMFTGIGANPNFSPPMEKDLFNKEYGALVENTAVYRKQLSAYVLGKLSKGSHPDVDAKFWDDWKEPERVNIRSMEPLLNWNQRTWATLIGALASLFLVIVATIKGMVWISRKFARPNRR